MRVDRERCDSEPSKLPVRASSRHVEDGLLSYQIVITYHSTVLIVTNLTTPLGPIKLPRDNPHGRLAGTDTLGASLDPTWQMKSAFQGHCGDSACAVYAPSCPLSHLHLH